MAAGDLLGRETELAVLGAFLQHAATEPRTLVIDGEPGIGKTTLWLEALARAERLGLRTLFCRGAEAEAKLSFSALSDLLEPVPDEYFATLPDPQRRALDVALLTHRDKTLAASEQAICGARRTALEYRDSGGGICIAAPNDLY